MQKHGLCFHVYHNRLVDYCWDIDKRTEYIEKHKPAHEIDVRLGSIKLIPNDKLPAILALAGRLLHDARLVRDTADESAEITGRQGVSYSLACSLAGIKSMAGDVLDMLIEAHMGELVAIHEEVYPDCGCVEGELVF